MFQVSELVMFNSRTGGAGTEVHNDPALDLSAVDAGGYWVRVTEDGSSLAVREAVSLTGLDSATPSYTASAFSCTGGTFGFYYLDGINGIDRFILKSYNASTDSFPTAELDENFVIDSSSYTSDKLAYDANGNLTYDGTQSYTYDAWNRLTTAAHAYRIAVADGGDGNVHSGQVGGMYSYDAMGRRIVKAVNGTGVMDCTYNDYYSGQSVVEERNGSNIPIKDHVWGLGYIDEAVQTRVNTNPTGTASWTSYWLCQDANYNVLGVVNASGVLVERYEYSAYGQRQVYASAGSNDPGCYLPASMSGRVVATGSVVEPYGINDVGHQGLVHDEESGLVYNRARMLQPTLGRFMQEDPMGYVDGADSYLYNRANPIDHSDFPGTISGTPYLSGTYDTQSSWVDWLDSFGFGGGGGGLTPDEILADMQSKVGSSYDKDAKPGSCKKCFKYVQLGGHGAPGVISLGGIAIDTSLFNNYARWQKSHPGQLIPNFLPAMSWLQQLSSYLCAKATIEFVACKAGAGDGGALLKKQLTAYFKQQGEDVDIVLHVTDVKYGAFGGITEIP